MVWGANRSGSIPRLRSQREKRVQLSTSEPCFDSLKHLHFTSRAIVETGDITHDNTTSVAVSGFRVSRLAASDITLNSVLEIVCVWIDVTWSPWLVVLEEKWRSTLGRGLGSGTVHIAGAAKHWFVRFAWLVSYKRRPEGLFGGSVSTTE